MDSIHITGIRSYGYIGYLPEEQVLGQWFEVDVTLWLDLSKPGKTDNLEDTINYATVVTTVKQIIKTAKFALIERLADEIAQALLQMPLIEQVKINLSKPAAPIPDFSGNITIEISRTKSGKG